MSFQCSPTLFRDILVPTLFARRPPQPPALSNWTRLRKPQHFQLASEILLSSKVTFSPVRIGWCIYCYLCLVEFFKILHSLTPLCQNGYSESLHRHQRSSRHQRDKPTKSRVSMQPSIPGLPTLHSMFLALPM